MEFSADTKLLAEVLDQVQEAVEKKSTVPILSHVLVETSTTGLRLAATDLELGIRTFCPAQVKALGSAAAPARRLLEIVRSLPEGEVRVLGLENQWVQVRAGRSLFKLAALAKDKFPSLPEVPKALAETPAGVLSDAPPRRRTRLRKSLIPWEKIICPARPTRPHCVIFLC